MDRRDFLRSSGLVVMAGAAGFLTTEQFVRGDGPFQLGSSKSKLDTPPEQSDPREVAASEEKQRPTLVTIFLRGGAGHHDQAGRSKEVTTIHESLQEVNAPELLYRMRAGVVGHLLYERGRGGGFNHKGRRND